VDALSPGTLEDKVAIVTGAGAGIGKAIALRFAREGATVVVASRTAADVNAVVEAIRGQGGKAHGVTVDVSHPDQVEALVAKAQGIAGRIDVLVNNAGIMDDFTPVAQVTDDLWRRVLGVNLDGPFYLCRAVLPLMLRHGSGSIVNIASIGGLQGGRAGAAYTASKHGLVGLTRNLAYMYAKTGVRCNAIAPGGVQTTIGDKMHPDPFGYQRMAAGLGNAVRVGQPEEIADVALFLATPASSYVNGAVVTADAGWTAY
jgi:NAD(P)-dependent dehydrogenase (short-subunit alcohol dehydrogenase family)